MKRFGTWVIHLRFERFDRARSREISRQLVDYHRNCFYEIYNTEFDRHFYRELVFCTTKKTNLLKSMSNIQFSVPFDKQSSILCKPIEVILDYYLCRRVIDSSNDHKYTKDSEYPLAHIEDIHSVKV